MSVPLSLAVDITSANGGVTTLGSASNRAAEVPQDVVVTTKLGTGFESASFGLARPLHRDYASELLREARVTGAGNFRLFEGEVTGNPRGKDIEASGFWRALKDLQYSEIYVDADMSGWGDMPITRKANLLAGGYDLGSYSWSTDGDGLVCALPNQALGATAFAETWYKAPPQVLVSKIIYSGSEALPAGYAGPILYSNDTDDASGGVSTALTLDGTERTVTPSRACRFQQVLVNAASTAATPAAGNNRRFTKLNLFGNHGLTTIDAASVIKDAIGRAGGPVSYTADSIEATTFAIPQLVVERQTVEQVIARVNAFHLWWPGVWDNKTLWYRSSPALDDYDYTLSLYEGDTFNPTGDRVDDDGPFDGVWVSYQDVANGNRREIVGPLGTSAPYDANGDSLLRDTLAGNPRVDEARPGHAQLELSFPTTRAAAITLGSIYLVEHKQPSRAGEGTTTGYVRNRAGARVPAYMIRAGDRVRYSHERDIVRRVYGTRYNDRTKEMTLSFDNAPWSLDGIMERLGIRLAGIRS